MSKNPHAASRVNKGPDADDRFTPRYLIEALHKEFRFTLDPCGHPKAPATEVIASQGRGEWGYYGVDSPWGYDGLQLTWKKARVFCNPPFSNIPAWVEKATNEIQAECPLVVMLLPWNRQEQPWWHEYIEPFRDGQDDSYTMRGVTITTIALGGGQYGVKGRVRYGTPDDPEGKRPKNSPNFGSGLVIWRGNT